MNCLVCGRFMRLGGYYSNDHYDSWEETWKCTVSHISQNPKTPSLDGILGSKIQKARDNLVCNCEHRNVSHGYGDPGSTPWREGSFIGLGPCGVDACTCTHFSEKRGRK